ncbi:MAG: ATP-binding protein [Cocleimonas sp.]
MTKRSLKPSELYTKTNPKSIDYKTTADVDNSVYDVIGQDRALSAIDFAVGINRDNYNLYLAGSKGLGKYEVIQRVLEQHIPDKNPSPDWCYVDNFEEFYKPIAIEIPAGKGIELRDDMAQLVDDLIIAVPAVYENDDYRNSAMEVESAAEDRKAQAFAKLAERADAEGITMINTPTGYTIVPIDDGKPMPEEKFLKLSEKKQKETQAKIDELKEDLKKLIIQIPTWEKETREKYKLVNTAFAASAVQPFLQALKDKYADIPKIKKYLDKVSSDIVLNMQFFIPDNSQLNMLGGQAAPRSVELRRYEVNVLVNNSKLESVPIVYENNPTYNNLIGRIEHVAQDGALITDFTLIKPGSLHKANGGYLIIDMHNLLMNQFAWEGLKRTLYAKEIRLETLERMLSLVSTVSLEPEAIPLDVKVVLVGDRHLYHLLKTYDPEFNELFKATADFSESFDRSEESIDQLAQLISALASKEKVRPINRQGVARIIEQCSRETGDAEKLSLHMGQLKDLILESDYWANKQSKSRVGKEQVQQAIDARINRADQMQHQIREQILRGVVLIDTDGVCVGQINGLAVYQLGDYSFGQPSRITATARLGQGSVLDIEREIKMGGPIHSKGVMILSSCLANRYARNSPLPVSATLVFEQNYGGVDGDSASIAEFCALISALTDIPIKQFFAVTGSINQHGETQAIGGVNQKIEGFFDVCKARGFSKEQGVIIPHSNLKHLMLRADVVKAVKDKQFSIHTVEHVDDALELLLNMDIGKLDKNNNYPEGTINYRVIERLQELHELRKQYAMSDEKSKKAEDE